MERFPKVAIVYLSYRNEADFEDVVQALKRVSYPKEKLSFVVVDNFHPEHGSSVRAIEENFTAFSGKEIPEVIVLPQKENLGFAGGNNVGAKWAVENGYEYIFFHNGDGFVARDCISKLVEAMEKDKNIAIAQSLVLLYPETQLVNTSGNVFQYLGFGYGKDYKVNIKDLDLPEVVEIDYASGAAMMVRAADIKDYGMWDEDFFMYHEDMEWSLRLRSVGKKIVMVKDSIFYHKYQFSRSIAKFYYMERNRIGVMLMFFKTGTLIMMLPIALALEAGLWLYAWRGGYVDKHIDVYKYWKNKKNWQTWLAKRKKIQDMRQVTDRYLLSYSQAGIHFQEKFMKNPALDYIGNPIMKVYYWIVVKGLIHW